jgi:Zn-finger nucleic acid-binding protein
MKKNREKLRAEFLAEAEELFDELMEWDDENEAPDLTQIEDIVLKLRKRFGERIVEKVILRQEQRQPAERVYCPQCGEEMGPKGLKGNQVENYYCPQCKQGIFPPGSAVDDLGEAVE